MPYISTFYIANQCPLSGGNAVFRARAILRKYVDIVYDDANLCQLAGLQWRASETEQSVFEIYPNPANSGFTVKYPEIATQDCVLELVNLYGQVIQTFQLSNHTHSINLSALDLTQGLYFVQMKIPGRATEIEKLIIIH